MPIGPESFIPPGARIKVIGVGGGGGNAVNTMIKSGLEGVDFITANTDVQSLRFSLAPYKLQVGKELTRGLGAGADPDIGRDAALEDRHEIQDILAGADMVFITAGMGGGTGTGGASVVAQIARELGALTVAVVTKPFTFEGKRRRKHSEVGIARLRECVDTLITIPNQRLLQVANAQTSMIEAFKMADDVLVNAVRGISDIINIPGMVNVDFADVKTVMSCMGQALMGIGCATGETRAADAARQAISSPLLEDIDIEGATGILINITAGSDVTLMEVNEACSIIQEAAHEDANIIFGTVIDESLGGQIRVTVIATGFPVDKDETTGLPTESSNKPSSNIIPPYATRLTSPGLITQPKAAARPTTQPHHYSPLTQKKPELPRASAPLGSTPAYAQAAASHHGMAAPQHAAPALHQSSPIPSLLRPEPAVDLPRAPAPSFAAPVAGSVFSATGAGLHGHAPQTAETELARHGAAVPTTHNEASEAQDLARWTLDALVDADVSAELASDIPSLAAAAIPMELLQDEREFDAETSAASAEARLEGARALVEPGRFATVETSSLAETLFGEGYAEGVTDAAAFAEDDQDFLLAGGSSGAESTEIPRAGAAKGAAPLESFFEHSGTVIASDIDRKIDEALELAERMRMPHDVKRNEEDDLDVPAFLRNGMKDLPLD